MAEVSIDKVRRLIMELIDNEKFINQCVDAMAKTGHTWHGLPDGETPNFGQIQGMLMNLMVNMMNALEEKPDCDRQRTGCGGFYMYYIRWDHGSEEISIHYSPVSLTYTV